MKEYLKNINPIMTLFVLLGLRVVVVGGDVGTAFALASLCALYGFKEHLVSKKAPDVNQVVMQELEAIKTYVTGLSVKQIQVKSKDPIPVPNRDLNQRWF